jgi:hypothetical protein
MFAKHLRMVVQLSGIKSIYGVCKNAASQALSIQIFTQYSWGGAQELAFQIRATGDWYAMSKAPHSEN